MLPILHKLGLYALGASVVLGIAWVGYNHYTGLLEEIKVLEGDRRALETSLEIQRATVDELEEIVEEWRRSAEETQEQLRRLRTSEREARSEIRRLNDIFARHDLAALARAKPGLVTRRLNDGTRRVFRVLECVTTPPGRCDADGRPEASSDRDPAPATDPDAAGAVGDPDAGESP